MDTPEHRARCAVLSLLGTYLRLCEDVPHQAISSWTTVAMLCSLLWELEFRETARRMVRQKPSSSSKQGSITAAPCAAGPLLSGVVGAACCESYMKPGSSTLYPRGKQEHLPDWMLHPDTCVLKSFTSP